MISFQVYSSVGEWTWSFKIWVTKQEIMWSCFKWANSFAVCSAIWNNLLISTDRAFVVECTLYDKSDLRFQNRWMPCKIWIICIISRTFSSWQRYKKGTWISRLKALCSRINHNVPVWFAFSDCHTVISMDCSGPD